MSDAIPLERLLRLRGTPVARLSKDGLVLGANDAFCALLRAPSHAGWSAARGFVSPSFEALRQRAELGADVLHEGPMDLGAPDQVATSLRAVVVRQGDEILLVGEVDHRAYETVAHEVMTLNAELAELQREQRRTIARLERTEKELREALAQVKTLRGLLPICARCKKIENGAGTWERLETYVERHTEAQLSHGLCKDCLADELRQLDGDEA